MDIIGTLKNLQNLSEKVGQAMRLKGDIEQMAQDVRALMVAVENLERRLKGLQELVKGMKI
jgi:predicted DNA-binding protein